MTQRETTIPTEAIFTCLKCQANYEVAHLPQPVTECPVCGWCPTEGR